MRWQYTDEGGGSLDSKPPATKVDTKYILFALRMFTERFTTFVLRNPVS